MEISESEMKKLKTRLICGGIGIGFVFTSAILAAVYLL